MKTLLSFTISFLISINVWSSTDWQESAILVSDHPALQQQVDEVTEEIFQSRLNEVFCRVYNNSYSASHALGISQNAAARIFQHCPNPTRYTLAKVLEKKYYIAFSTPPGLDSWTDFGNRTYIFADQFLNRSKLKSIVLHEMSIATDAKTNMLLSNYLIYRGKEHSQIKGDLQIITLDNLTPQEESLRQAFNWSTWNPIRLAFTALRAFNLERYAETGTFDNSHETCVAEFNHLLKTIKNLPAAPKATGIDLIPELLVEQTSKFNAPKSPEHETAVIEFLTSNKLRLKDIQDKDLSFCQFMSFPLPTGKSLYSFYGSGPRPRLTGGSGGQGGGKVDSQWRKDIEPLTIEFQKTPIPSVKLDQLQEAIQKIKEAHPIPIKLEEKEE